jgi:hypothetical protein
LIFTLILATVTAIDIPTIKQGRAIYPERIKLCFKNETSNECIEPGTNYASDNFTNQTGHVLYYKLGREFTGKLYAMNLKPNFEYKIIIFNSTGFSHDIAVEALSDAFGNLNYPFSSNLTFGNYSGINFSVIEKNSNKSVLNETKPLEFELRPISNAKITAVNGTINKVIGIENISKYKMIKSDFNAYVEYKGNNIYKGYAKYSSVGKLNIDGKEKIAKINIDIDKIKECKIFTETKIYCEAIGQITVSANRKIIQTVDSFRFDVENRKVNIAAGMFDFTSMDDRFFRITELNITILKITTF